MTQAALSPAQRSLVEKGLAVQRARDEKQVIKAAIDAATRRHVSETRERCRAQHLAHDRDRSLIIRHVGEELARVAQRDHSSWRKPVRAAAVAPGDRETSGNNNKGQCDTKTPADLASPPIDEDEYDEERFGSVRRPPRPRKPNIWLQIFEHEQAEVKQEREEQRRRRLAAAAEFRCQLSEQESLKHARAERDRQREDEYAKQQAMQAAAWKEQEKEKQRRRQLAAEEEVQRCKEELRVAHELSIQARKKKELQEQRTIARYQALMEEEKRQKELRKIKEKELMEKVAQANEQQLALKRQERQREQDEEVRLQREYAKKLELQEAARVRELQEVLSKQSQKVKMALLNVKSAEEKAREDEERAAIVQAQVRQREEEAARAREAKRKAIIQKQIQALKEQKEEKQQRFRQEVVAEEAYAVEFKQDYLTWVEKQKQSQLEVRKKNVANGLLVRRQMDEDARRRADEDKYGMSKREMALNAALLKKIGIEKPPPDASSR
ncbi:hypothetical protein ATCC90586_004059 [Pythium insidiosum]|nr:hypothetical protein ATCC90586_004059 [Pythium insidiosum]